MPPKSFAVVSIKREIYDRFQALATPQKRSIAAEIEMALDLYESWVESQRSMAAAYRIGDPAPENAPTPQAE